MWKSPSLVWRSYSRFGIGAFTQQRAVIVRCECLLKFVGIVGEVEDHRFFFVRAGAVQPRQSLYCIHPAKLLVHVHRVQERLIEAGLELVGHDQEPVLVPLEGIGGLRVADLLSGEPFMPASVYSMPLYFTVPEKATKVLNGCPSSSGRYRPGVCRGRHGGETGRRSSPSPCRRSAASTGSTK